MGGEWLLEQLEKECDSKNYQERLKEVVVDVIDGNLTRRDAIKIVEERTEMMKEYTEELEYHPDYQFLQNTSYDPKNPQHRAVLKALYDESDNYTDSELEF